MIDLTDLIYFFYEEEYKNFIDNGSLFAQPRYEIVNRIRLNFKNALYSDMSIILIKDDAKDIWEFLKKEIK